MTSWLAVYTGNSPFYLDVIIRYNHHQFLKILPTGVATIWLINLILLMKNIKHLRN